MAAPTVSWHINSGTEGVPTWTEVLATDAFYFTGPATTPTSADPVTAPASGAKLAEELWKGDASPYANGVQCTTYDGTVNTNQNLMRVYFADNPTSTPPELHAWDANDHTSADKEILAGTVSTNNTSYIKAIETTDGAPGPGWCNETTANTPASGGATGLRGDDGYITCSSAAIANSEKLFNLVCYVCAETGAGLTGHDPVLTVKYTYT